MGTAWFEQATPALSAPYSTTELRSLLFTSFSLEKIPTEGLEPSRLPAPVFKSSVTT